MQKLLAAAALTLAWAWPAHADRVYTVYVFSFNVGGDKAEVVGSITTDGALGVLQPDDILSSQFTSTLTKSVFDGGGVNQFTSSHGVGGGGNWTPGSLSATATDLDFDFGFHTSNVFGNDSGLELVQFVNSLSFGGFSYFPTGERICSVPCTGGGPLAELFIANIFQYVGRGVFGQIQPVVQIASNGTLVDPVPGPVLGAGLPGLVVAVGGLLGWRRRKRPAMGSLPVGVPELVRRL